MMRDDSRRAVMSDRMTYSIAPHELWQAINPWTFTNSGQWGLINISFGATPRPDIEQEVLQEVGSYGKQLGRLGDALEVLIRRLDTDTLSKDERDTLEVALGQLAQVRAIKRRMGRNGGG
jgi:hypothetical protein